MTREEEKEVLHLVQAWVEGKTLQYSFGDGWKDVNLEHMLCDILKYRIKPEPKYRPFHNVEECWDEMQKHQPFGWVKSKDKGYFHLIGLVQFASELGDVMITFATSEQFVRSSRSISEKYIFADGAPFGIKEEQI